MITSVATPAFCSTPTRVWPFKVNLPDIVLIYTSFDQSQFSFNDFATLGVSTSSSIHKSVRKRQAEFLAARVCAMVAIRMLGRTDSAPGIGPHREPLWHDSIIGSITHTDNVAAAAATYSKDYQGIGIDYEVEIPQALRNNIVHEILTPHELTHYHRLAEQDRAQFFTLVFSLKESFFKAAFRLVGFYFDFQTVRVTDLNSEQGTAKLIIVTTLSDSFQEGSSYNGLFFSTATVVGTLVVIEKPTTPSLS